MLEFIFLTFVVWNFFFKDKREECEVGGTYIDTFSFRIENIGTMKNENWVSVEPEYDRCYVNVLSTKDGITLFVDKREHDDALESYLCFGAADVESKIRIARIDYPNAVVKRKNDPVWLNVLLEEDIIILQKDDYPYNDAFDVIQCIDENECYRLLREARKHFQRYRFVSVRYAKP